MAYLNILKEESTEILESYLIDHFINYPEHFHRLQNNDIIRQENTLENGKTRIKEEIKEFLAFQILVIRLHTLPGDIQKNLEEFLEKDVKNNINQINTKIKESSIKINKLPKIENRIENIEEKIDELSKIEDKIIEKLINEDSPLCTKEEQNELNIKVTNIEKKLDKLLKIEDNIVKRLTDENSPLCTKEEQNKLNIKVANIEGKLSTNFRTTISAAVTTVISIVGGMLLIYNKAIPTNINPNQKQNSSITIPNEKQIPSIIK